MSAIRCGARVPSPVQRKSVEAYSTEGSRFGGLGYFAEAVSIRDRRKMNDAANYSRDFKAVWRGGCCTCCRSCISCECLCAICCVCC